MYVQTIFDIVQKCSESIDNGRTRDDVLKHTMEELGELSTECIIADGKSYKTAGPDGIIGESVDLIICALDMIYLEDPTMTEEELMITFRSKCDKWKQKSMK